MEEKEVKYEEYYVAHLDILGFKDMIKNKSCEEIYKIMKYAEERLIPDKGYSDESVNVFREVKYKIMSDSIVVYIKPEVEDSFYLLLLTCQALQIALLNQEEPILLRGGITKGSLFVDNDIVFGEGLTNAYLIENNVAVYPRIVFNRAILIKGKETIKNINEESLAKTYFTDDEDEFCIINFLAIDYFKKSDYGVKYINNILKTCNNNIDNIMDLNIRKKYLWLKTQVSDFIFSNAKTLKDYPQWLTFISEFNDVLYDYIMVI